MLTLQDFGDKTFYFILLCREVLCVEVLTARKQINFLRVYYLVRVMYDFVNCRCCMIYNVMAEI